MAGPVRPGQGLLRRPARPSVHRWEVRMKLPERDERVLIRWPGGPYDFLIRFDRAARPELQGWEDWVILYGLVVQPDGPGHRAYRGFFVKPSEAGGYELLPKREP